MLIAKGKNLEDLWLNLLIYTACDETYFFHPIITMRYLFAETDNFYFEKSQLYSDFFKYSDYNMSMKIGQLRKEYWTGKVEKQFDLIKEIFHELKPNQARASIYFSEPAFDKTSKLKCLESLYLQKVNKTEYEAFLIFRNTEIYPKLFMDFIYIKELLDELDKTAKVKCIGFRAMIVNAFLNLHQAKLVEMLLKDWGISKFSDNFFYMLKEFDRKYNKENINSIKLTSIKRVLERTFTLLEERGS